MAIQQTWWLQITSGRGPAECCWVVGRLAEALIKEGMALGLELQVLEADPGQEPKTFSSMLLAVTGRDITPVLAWEGTSSGSAEVPSGLITNGRTGMWVF